MEDLELVGLAAKAVGYDVDFDDYLDCGSHFQYRIRSTSAYWNPIATDGDALRLAVRLRIAIIFHHPDDRPGVSACFGIMEWSELLSDDENAATRRAIVNLAALIGKAM